MTLSELTIEGFPAVAVVASTGTHTGLLALARWDGAAMQVVFAGETLDGRTIDPPAIGMQGLRLEDLDGDGTPEVVAWMPALCVYNWAGPPHRPIVYRRDGSAYVAATAGYPEIVATAIAEVEAVLATTDEAALSAGAEGQACLRALLAELEQLGP